jgi:hypothetical protein
MYVCVCVFSPLQCHNMSLMDFAVFPPGCGRSVTDFWGGDAPEAQLRGTGEVDMMVIYEHDVPGGALNLSSTKLPRPWSPWESFSSRKNPHGRTGNRTQDLMISSRKLWLLDHEASLITNYNIIRIIRLHTIASLPKTSSVILCLM